MEARDKDVLAVGPVQVPMASVGQAIISAGISTQLPLLLAWLRKRVRPEPDPSPPRPARARKRR